MEYICWTEEEKAAVASAVAIARLQNIEPSLVRLFHNAQSFLPADRARHVSSHAKLGWLKPTVAAHCQRVIDKAAEAEKLQQKVVAQAKEIEQLAAKVELLEQNRQIGVMPADKLARLRDELTNIVPST
jgi:DNA helicase IV